MRLQERKQAKKNQIHGINTNLNRLQKYPKLAMNLLLLRRRLQRLLLNDSVELTSLPPDFVQCKQPSMINPLQTIKE
jgi:hypothetical protein